MKILHLTLNKNWFDLTAQGIKKNEYREQKVHWDSRILDDQGKLIKYDEIHYTNGYGKDKPFMRVKWIGCTVQTSSGLQPQCGEPLDRSKFYYVIGNGEILETRNWKK